MDNKYMPFDMQNNYYDFRNSEEERRDIDYLKRLYPEQTRNIQELVEDLCDKLEYDGSVMFDEYPDKLMLHAMSNNICRDCRTDDNRNWVNDIVPILLYNEMYRRRSRRRNHRGARGIWAGYPPLY